MNFTELFVVYFIQYCTILFIIIEYHSILQNFIDFCGLLFQMEQHALKHLNNSLNTNIFSYLEPSGAKSYNL